MPNNNLLVATKLIRGVEQPYYDAIKSFENNIFIFQKIYTISYNIYVETRKRCV